MMRKKIIARKSNIESLKNRRSVLRGHIKDEELNQENKEALYDFSKNLKNINMKKLGDKERMTYLRLFVEKIIVYRDRVEVIYKFESNTTKKDIKKTTDSQKDEKSIVSAVSVMEVPSGFEPL